MVLIRFTSEEGKKRALAWLLGRFSFQSFATGEMLVSEAALPSLAREGIAFECEGPASYDEIVASLRVPVAAPVQ
jgi:hypothetical protein